MKFKIETILSIAYPKLLANIGEIYEILNYMTNDNLYTHQLPRACRFCQPFVLAQHPQLDKWGLYNALVTSDNYEEYIKEAKELFGESLDIQPIPNGVWTQKDPVEELSKMVDKDKIIVVDIDKKDENFDERRN